LGNRCDDEKKLASEEAIVVPLDRSWLSLSENPNVPQKTNRSENPKKRTVQKTPKNEPFSQDIHSKLPTLDRGWDLPIFKAQCRTSGLHVSVK
jgi:hypothetical protein